MDKEISNQKIEFFQEEIIKWYKINGRKFMWRQDGLTHYQYVIAEVLLQRTKAETVAKFYPIFLNNFPNWISLVNSDIQKIENYLKPVGLYKQRSKRLYSLAQEMVKRDEKIPTDRKELESIPFFGQYIANAIELIIFKKPKPLMDVNMARVLERFFGERKMVDIRYDPYLQALSYKIVNKDQAKDINWGILDFAAIVCKAVRPLCYKCSLNIYCKYNILHTGQFPL